MSKRLGYVDLPSSLVSAEAEKAYDFLNGTGLDKLVETYVNTVLWEKFSSYTHTRGFWFWKRPATEQEIKDDFDLWIRGGEDGWSLGGIWKSGKINELKTTKAQALNLYHTAELSPATTMLVDADAWRKIREINEGWA